MPPVMTPPPMPVPPIPLLSKRSARRSRASVAPVDPTPYRRRAQALLDRYDRGDLDVDGLRAALADLVDDLRSVGTAPDEVEALTRLLARLEDGSFVGDPEALRTFADGTGGTGGANAEGTAAASGRRSFWKRG